MSCGEALAAEMRKQGFRVTPQRAVILESIAHGEGHQTVQEVFEAAHQRLPGLNIATVYRTLDRMHAAGIVDLLSSGTESVRFALRDAADPHLHLLCRCCGSVFDLPLKTIEGLQEQILRQRDFQVEEHHLTLGGICGRCLEAEGDE